MLVRFKEIARLKTLQVCHLAQDSAFLRGEMKNKGPLMWNQSVIHMSHLISSASRL